VQFIGRYPKSERKNVFSRDCPNAILVYLYSYQELWWTFVDKNLILHRLEKFAEEKTATEKGEIGTTNKETQNQ
jgi:hypothetical protein